MKRAWLLGLFLISCANLSTGDKEARTESALDQAERILSEAEPLEIENLRVEEIR